MDAVLDPVPVRAARDRVIDAIGLGDTYPLTDLNVIADRLKVPFGGTVSIPIAHAQHDVRYELCSPTGTPLGAAHAGDGAGATLSLESPPVGEDVTYRVRATKLRRVVGLPPQAPRFLQEPAPVKVGLDTTLPISIGEVWDSSGVPLGLAPLLDTLAAEPQPSDPRIVPYGARVAVGVARSQEGVEYSVVVDGVDADEMRLGDLKTITLRTPALFEDAVIQVRATKRFAAEDQRDPESSLLDARLFVSVRANPGVGVTMVGSSLVDHGAAAVLRIAGTQPTAQYRAFVRPIRDREFVHGAPGNRRVAVVPVPGEEPVQVIDPLRPGPWQIPDGFLPVSDEPAAGNGGDLDVRLPTCAEDTLVVVQASKAHWRDRRGDVALPMSAIRLSSAAVILVRPDPSRPLALRVPVAGAELAGSVEVTGGQPGVMYEVREKGTGTPLARPAYFHQVDDEDPTQNKGVGQLGIGIDLVVAADRQQTGGATDPARVRPQSPQIEVGARPADVVWTVRAIKAQTRVSIEMPRDASVPGLPMITAESTTVEPGRETNILIERSRVGERYVCSAGGVVRSTHDGTGDTLRVPSGPIQVDTVFEIAATRPEDTGIAVVRTTRVPVTAARV